MAAGKFFFYTTGFLHVCKGNIGLATHTLNGVLLHSGYTPSTASHSTLAQLASFRATASGSVVAELAVGNFTITGSGGTTVKFDMDNVEGYSQGGDTFKAKYYAIYAASASDGGNDNLLVGFVDLDTASTTGVEGTQLNLTVNANGLHKINVNGG